MKRVFADTNVFLRFLTRDEEGQFERAGHLFAAAAEGRVALVTGPPVLFELAWTLRRAYKVPRERCLDVLSALAALRGLTLLDRERVEAALALARQNGREFADAYIAASASATAEALATFDRADFARLGVELWEWEGG
jgi:predicted nucleic acid-binding protein